MRTVVDLLRLALSLDSTIRQARGRLAVWSGSESGPGPADSESAAARNSDIRVPVPGGQCQPECAAAAAAAHRLRDSEPGLRVMVVLSAVVT